MLTNQLAKNGYTYTVTDEESNEVTYQSGAYSAVHKADFVGRPPIILGGNPATGGECIKCYSHSSYYAEVPTQYLMDSTRTNYVDKRGNIVPENQRVIN